MFQKNKTRKMSLSRALDKYLKTVSVHKKGHLQEFYRVNVIKRHPMADRYMGGTAEFGKNRTLS